MIREQEMEKAWLCNQGFVTKDPVIIIFVIILLQYNCGRTKANPCKIRYTSNSKKCKEEIVKRKEY